MLNLEPPLLEHFEYAYPENDSQLQSICDMSTEIGQMNALWQTELGGEQTNAKDDWEQIITFWDLVEREERKPWWKFLDQFKHKPP